MTKLSGPARDGSSTRVFAPLTLEIVNDHTSRKRYGEGAHRIECMYKGISRYITEYGDIDSFFSRPALVRIRRSGSGHVQVRGPARSTLRCFVVMFHMLCTVHVLIISCFSSHSSLSSSLRSHLFLLCILTGAFLPLPTLLVSL